MTKVIILKDLPSKKYKNELENGIHYEDVEKNMKVDKLTTDLEFWSTRLPQYLGTYINDYMGDWSNSNSEKRCRDLNHILDFILKRIQEKKQTNPLVSYNLIEEYINKAAEAHFTTWGNMCTRKSKLSETSDDIKNIKKIDDLCEDIDYIKNRIPEINSDNCKQIQNYIEQQISELGQIYRTSDNKYSHILGYYSFKSFDDFDSTIKKLKIKCQEGNTGEALEGDLGEMQHNSSRNASIIAVTSLSGILSSFFLLYKTTSFGSILNNLVGKKIKFGNDLSNEECYETLEGISESSHSGAYNILYNTTGDS
ncbi:PIR Superfamily Protein [Plasmodium ovale wallikeri]|uniref:PIR Superfamily Protein n=2 Tax=Plasmodium ovale TaxID=36330 RepID=A0A1A9AGB0_PLAOA|nr:PIR Superfamily Protein [Plasmodium ovale wallikeri]SBT55596.1 PIR Superfamily Protein [Plasmodium ovale wallikeri]SBT72798.1 hypothetical protein, conserved [Plasmodium ovale]